MSEKGEYIKRLRLSYRKRISRSFESIFNKFIEKKETHTPYSDPPTSRRTRIPAPYINLDSDPSSDSETYDNIIIQRNFSIKQIDFSLLEQPNMATNGSDRATANVTVLKALSLVKDFGGESASETFAMRSTIRI